MRLFAACVLCAAALPAAAVPSFDSVRGAHRPSDIELLDRHREPIQVLRVDAQSRRGAWVAIVDLSPALREAIVLSEDRQFWQHSGVDWRALAASAWANAWNTRTRGASTLTMQLAGLIDPELARPAQGRDLVTKARQIAAARRIDARWSKSQILEAYLNLVPLRGELVGVPAAAQQLFGKHPSGLDRSEAALIAALVRGPNAAEALLVRRACELLQTMGERCEGVATLTAQALARRPGAARGEALAPHFGRAWLAAGGGTVTTLDAPMQRLALHALRQQLAELRGRNVEDGAVVVLHNRSGEIRAWVGGSVGGDVDAVLARRQPGSALKPFVYAEAIAQRLITADSLLLDEPLQLASGRDAYQPQNFDHAWRGWVSVREALASSLNVPAVRVGAMLGPDAMFASLQRAGLDLRESPGFHGHALALGSAEVTLLNLSNAYRMLANAGIASAVAWPGTAGSPARRALDAGVARQVADILADPVARASTFGLDSPLVTRRGAAVKTGTSKDMRDNWCIGFTREHTIGVWLGNRSGAPMHGVSGVIGAAPVWARLVEALPASDGWASERIAPRPETIMPTGVPAHRIEPLRDGAMLAMDPDIPIARQRIRLSGPPGEWRIDGKAVGQGTAVWWAPAPGRHRIELRDAERRLLDAITVDVRPGIGPGPAGVSLKRRWN